MCMIRASLNPAEGTWVEEVFRGTASPYQQYSRGVERAIRDIESNNRISSVFVAYVRASQKYGSGGWSFGSHSGPSNHRLRVESVDQSQGYEPCGLNLDRLLRRESTPPRYKRRTGFDWF